MVSTKAQLLWLETRQDNKQRGKNRDILKPSWAFVETNIEISTVCQNIEISAVCQNIEISTVCQNIEISTISIHNKFGLSL